MLGSALTVRVRPGDNLRILKAMQMARPGDVLVIDGSADLTRAVFGGIMRAMALKAGIVGVVINGALRDLDEWQTGELPAYAIGGVHRGPSTDGGGEINVPIAISGMVINPGDLILGDADGLLCVPFEAAEQILDAALGKCAAEKVTVKEIEEDRLDITWIDAQLARLGYKA